jgi:trimeric autotransporter adhesin
VAGGDNNGVADLAPHEDDSTLAVAAGRLFFTSTWGGLWTTDGTPAGTVRIEAVDTASFRPWCLVSNGAQVFFIFDDGIHGLELWASDGTEDGTRLVRDIGPGEISPMPWDLTALKGRVYFHAQDPVRGRELWVSDGTAAGTVLLKDVNPDGDAFSLGTALHTLRAVGGRLLFFADDGTHGNEPWATDGTPAGTALVADLRPGAGSSQVLADGFKLDRPRAAGGRLYFRAMGADESFDVWSSDGTPAGTARLARINVQTSAFEPLPVGRLRGFRSLGAIGAIGASGAGGRLLFSADDGASGSAPWITDGTAAGTARLPDLPRGLFPHQLEITPLGDLALFQASTGTRDNSVWATDGTPAGTVNLSAINAEIAWLTPLPARDAVLFSLGPGRRLVRSDGTLAGTVPIPKSTGGEAFTPLGGELIYRAAGHVLLATDGLTPRLQLRSFRGEINRLTSAGPLVFFTAGETWCGRELWKTDGTEAGTVLVKDIVPGPGSGLRQAYDLPDVRDELFASLGGRLIFTADGGSTGEELWTSDGTADGTVLLKDVFPGPRSSEIRHLTAAAGRVFFVAEDGVHGRELWATDGTAAGTRLVADIRPGPGSALPRELTEIDGVLLFAAEDGVRGVEPWKSDGTAAGTVAIQDIAPGALPSSPLAFTPAGPNVYFVATDGTAGFELWALPRAALSRSAGVPPAAPPAAATATTAQVPR